MMNAKRAHIVIVGAGEVGITLTLLLYRLAERGLIPESFSISLVDRAGEILSGASHAANINHASGYEYLKPGHQQTGIDCIHGGLTKLLLFDLAPLETDIENRFLLSADSVASGIATFHDFDLHVAAMQAAYARAFSYIAQTRGWSRNEATSQLGHDPDNFGVRLTAGEIADHPHVVGGFRSAGGSVRMAYNYAVKKSLLNRLIERGVVRLFMGEQLQSIRRSGELYRVMTTRHELAADLVVVAAAHGTPDVASRVTDGRPPPAGTFSLNGMLYVALEPTQDPEQLRLMSRVNFVLQGEGGCMYACCLPPSHDRRGYAAIYFPSRRGSQIGRYSYDPSAPTSAPRTWDEWIDHGLPDQMERERVELILGQVLRYNPFLRNHIVPLRLVVRSVFNPVVAANPLGTDVRVRQLIGSTLLTDDGRVLTLTAPKWTNVELACLSAVGMIFERLWDGVLPKHPDGFGPERLDIARLASTIRFPRVVVTDEMVAKYQDELNLPRFVAEAGGVHP